MNADIEYILQKANAHCAANNIALTTLGRMIVNDGKFFKRIGSGKHSCRVDTLQKVKNWFKSNPPKSLTNRACNRENEYVNKN